LSVALALTPLTASAADYPAPKQGDWIARDFRFHSGQTMPELRLHYTTIGEPTGQPVLVLHGSGGSAANLLTPAFAGELFGPGQPLDAAKYYVIIPDGLGHGKSSKPSDGMKTAFPKYNYDDMVDAHYRLIKEGLGIRYVKKTRKSLAGLIAANGNSGQGISKGALPGLNRRSLFHDFNETPKLLVDLTQMIRREFLGIGGAFRSALGLLVTDQWHEIAVEQYIIAIANEVFRHIVPFLCGVQAR
jgi:hypothetical protein